MGEEWVERSRAEILDPQHLFSSSLLLSSPQLSDTEVYEP